jgi:hypothetical protein
MSVAKLRTLSGALFKAPPGFLSQRIFDSQTPVFYSHSDDVCSSASLHLVLVQGDETCVLDDDLKELAYYGISSGDSLQITKE